MHGTCTKINKVPVPVYVSFTQTDTPLCCSVGGNATLPYSAPSIDLNIFSKF